MNESHRYCVQGKKDFRHKEIQASWFPLHYVQEQEKIICSDGCQNSH